MALRSRPPDRDAPTIGVADQGRQESRELAPVQSDIAIHGHCEDRRGTRGLHQVQQEQERRPVGPLQVVKDEQDGTARGHPLDPRVQRLEQPKAVGLRSAQKRSGRDPDLPPELGEQASDFPGDLADIAVQQGRRTGPRILP